MTPSSPTLHFDHGHVKSLLFLTDRWNGTTNLSHLCIQKLRFQLLMFEPDMLGFWKLWSIKLTLASSPSSPTSHSDHGHVKSMLLPHWLVKWNNQPWPTLHLKASIPIVDVSTGLARFLKVLITQTDICKHTIVSAIAFWSWTCQITAFTDKLVKWNHQPLGQFVLQNLGFSQLLMIQPDLLGFWKFQQLKLTSKDTITSVISIWSWACPLTLFLTYWWNGTHNLISNSAFKP